MHEIPGQALRILLIGLLTATPALSQESADLAKKTQNPIGDLISIPFQNNFNGGFGDDDEVFYNPNIQPVYPAGLSENWSLISRAIIPVLDAPFTSTERARRVASRPKEHKR